MVLMCVETNWPGSLFAVAVLGCRSLVLLICNDDKKKNMENPNFSVLKILEMFV